MISLIIFALVLFAFSLFVPVVSYAAWTPLIASTDFDGIKADVLTTSGGILAVLLVIIGVGMLIRVIGK